MLIGSPVHRKPKILNEFLNSLRLLKHESLQVGFLFVDDNKDPHSSELLLDFSKTVDHVTIIHSEKQDSFICDDETTHYWNDSLIWKVAAYKDMMIERAIELHYDYLFLVDSDLILHPETLKHLIQTEKDIISEIFWTKWYPASPPEPQVWLQDEYTQWHQEPGEQLTSEEMNNRKQQFFEQLRVPGIYEVGGLGACTLISRNAMTSGVRFKKIKNLSFFGEDRHFCIRACALGFSLFVDTHFPAYHIYRESDLQGAKTFLRETTADKIVPPTTKAAPDHFTNRQSTKPTRPTLTLSMIVKNESNRYLKQVLKEHRKYIDQAVIIDDGSTDETAQLCLDMLDGLPVHLVQNKESMFHNEIHLRKQQWEETLKMNPEWILNLDADEMFESRFNDQVHELLRQTDYDVYCFRLYDFWDEYHYREDEYWRSHLTYRPFLVRYRKDFYYTWNEVPLHCGRFPENIFELPHKKSELRLKHFGWVSPQSRYEKYDRYLKLDPQGRYGSKKQYETILDERPNLIKWKE